MKTTSSILIAILLFSTGVIALPASDSETQEATMIIEQNLTPLEVNRDQLVEMAVTGYVREPFITSATYRISPEGEARALPGTGSITYNFRVGDSAVDMAGDHVEPSVSITNDGS